MNVLAIVPSNQDHNRGLGGYNEYQAMHAIASQIAWMAKLFHRELMVHVFPGEPESRDPAGARYFWLRDQCRDALRYLVSLQVPPSKAAIVHIHSDSGREWSHVLGCYGSGPASRQLADCVSGAVEEYMGTGDRRQWDYSGWIFDVESGPYPSALIELGSHESSRDLPRLRDAASMGQAILKGALVYFDLAPEVPLEPEIPDEVYWRFLSPQFGEFPYNPDFAIPRAWRAARRLGDMAAFGPPIGPEQRVQLEDGREVVRQAFANGILEVDPSRDWHASRVPVMLEPDRASVRAVG